jgi:guanyl-specific ribonuclease Sa
VRGLPRIDAGGPFPNADDGDGDGDGELYWTDEHYESFRRISR